MADPRDPLADILASAPPLKAPVDPLADILAAAPPMRQAATAPPPPVQRMSDPFSKEADWLRSQVRPAPKMAAPPPPSPVEAPESAIRPEAPGKIPQTVETSPIGQTNAPIPGRIPGMERLGGAAPGVPMPPRPVGEVNAPSLAGDMAGGFVRGAGSAAMSVPRVLSRIPGGFRDDLEALRPTPPNQEFIGAEARAAEDARNRQQMAGMISRAEDSALPAAPLTVPGKFAEALGSTAPYMAAGAVGGNAATGALGVAAGVDEAMTRADMSGKPITDEQRALIGAGGAAIGSTEALPFARLLGKLKGAGVVAEAADDAGIVKQLFPGLKEYLTSAAKQGLEEGAQEGFSNLAQDAMEASYGARPTDKIGQDFFENAGTGGAVGVFIDALTTLAGSRAGRARMRQSGVDPDAFRAWAEQQNQEKQRAVADVLGVPVEAAQPAPAPAPPQVQPQVQPETAPAVDPQPDPLQQAIEAAPPLPQEAKPFASEAKNDAKNDAVAPVQPPVQQVAPQSQNGTEQNQQVAGIQQPESETQSHKDQPVLGKEPWMVPKSKLVPFSETTPRRNAPADMDGGYSEEDMNSRTLRNRALEAEPTEQRQHEIGSWAADSDGELMQLRRYKLDDPQLIFPEGQPNPNNQTVQKYKQWIEGGSAPPASKGIETEKGNIKIQDGHHRAAAIKAAGGDTIDVWVAVTKNRPLGNGQVMPEGVTHEKAVAAALAEGKPVPPEVLAEYPQLSKNIGELSPEPIPAPGPREEVVQPEPVDAAAPVAVDQPKESNAPLSPEAPPSPGPVEAAAPQNPWDAQPSNDWKPDQRLNLNPEPIAPQPVDADNPSAVADRITKGAKSVYEIADRLVDAFIKEPRADVQVAIKRRLRDLIDDESSRDQIGAEMLGAISFISAQRPINADDLPVFPVRRSGDPFSTPLVKVPDQSDAYRKRLFDLKGRIRKGEIPTNKEMSFLTDDDRAYIVRFGKAEGVDIPSRKPKAAPAAAPAPASDNAPAAPAPVDVPKVVGRKATAKTSRGYSVPVEWAVVPMSSLRISNDDIGRINPNYPQELQPRQRDRAASEVQVQAILGKLDPEQLGDNYLASDGSPIIGDDFAVESGNGRSMALRRAYQSNLPQAQQYRQWLENNSERFGVSRDQMAGIDQPVLVRVRTGLPEGVTRQDFTRDANEDTKQQMASGEQAMVDARSMSDELVSMFMPNETGDIATRANFPFIMRFIEQVVPEGQRGAMSLPNKSISKAGIDRIRNAVFARAYNDRGIVERLAEDPDDNIRSVVAALTVAAPKIIWMKSGIESGNFFDLDIAPEIAASASKLSYLRENRIPLNDYLNQMTLEPRDPVEDALLSIFNQYGRSSTNIAEIISDYVDGVQAAGNPKQESMFGPPEPPSKLALLSAIVEEKKARDEAARQEKQQRKSGQDTQPAGGLDEQSGPGGPGAGSPSSPKNARKAGKRSGESGDADGEVVGYAPPKPRKNAAMPEPKSPGAPVDQNLREIIKNNLGLDIETGQFDRKPVLAKFTFEDPYLAGALDEAFDAIGEQQGVTGSELLRAKLSGVFKPLENFYRSSIVGDNPDGKPEIPDIRKEQARIDAEYKRKKESGYYDERKREVDAKYKAMEKGESSGEVVGYAPEAVQSRPGTPSKATAKPTKAPGGKKGQMTSRSEIVKNLSSFLNDIPIRTGGFAGKGRGVLGIFKTRESIIRSGKALDLPTISHEIGHAIHKYIWGMEEIKTRNGAPTGKFRLNQKPLMPFKKELGALDYDPTQQRPFEGFAEYIRLRITDPSAATIRAPHFQTWLNQHLAQHPDLAAVLDQAQQQYRNWDVQPGAVKIAASISVKPTEKKFWEKFREGASSLSYNWVDDKVDIKNAVDLFKKLGATVTDVDNAYRLARMINGSFTRASMSLDNGRVNAKNEVDGLGLTQILKPIKDRPESEQNPRFKALVKDWNLQLANDGMDDLRLYLVGKRLQNYADNGLETGFDRRVIRDAIRATETPAIEKAAQAIHEYSDGILQYVVDKGGISKESAEMIRARNEFYVPLYRVMDNDSTKSLLGRKMLDLNSPIMQRKGSTREMIDPLESIVRNTYSMMSYADRNAVAQALVKQASRVQDQGWLIESGIVRPMKRTQFNLMEVEKQIKELLDDNGIDASGVDFDSMAAIYRLNTDSKRSEGIVRVVVDGVPQLFQMEKNLIRGLDSMSQGQAEMFMKLMSNATGVLRFGATAGNPEFVMTNWNRDQFMAGLNSRNGYIPYVDGVVGLFTLAFDKKLVNEWRRNGGATAAMMPLTRENLQRSIEKMTMGKRELMLRHPAEVITLLKDVLTFMGAKSEEATRVAEYRLARKKGKSAAEAAFDSRDVTLDFERMGHLARTVNQIIPFFAVSINAAQRFTEMHDPRNPKQAARAAALGFLGITIPSLMLWWMNKDDEKYKKIEAWKRDLFWLIPTKGTGLERAFGPFFRLPKPPLFGQMYGSAVERMADSLYAKNKHAFDGFGKMLFDMWTPPMTAQTFKPLQEVISNYNEFTDRPIETDAMRKRSSVNRYTTSTSETAKAMSRAFNSVNLKLSPAQIEHLMLGYTAGLGRFTMTVAEEGLGLRKDRPALGPAERPILRAFATPNTPFYSEGYKRFSEELKTLSQKQEDFKFTGAPADRLSERDSERLKAMRGVEKQLADIRSQQYKITKNKSLNRDQKTEQIDRLYEKREAILSQNKRLFSN